MDVNQATQIKYSNIIQYIHYRCVMQTSQKGAYLSFQHIQYQS